MDKRKPQSRHPDSIGQGFLSMLLPTLVLFLIAPSSGDAQVPEVTTNITSSGLGTFVQPPSAGVYNIIEGTRPGAGPNLFHSFGDFSVGSDDIANFLNNTGLQTSNIIGRVTGGNISNIDGTIQTTGFGNANLFLVNPSGFVIGPQGSVNVGGSVSFSTAQYLRLSDGVHSANFYTNPASDGLANSVLAVDPVANFGFLSSAAPAAYGFLTAPDPTATITVQGSTLQVPITLNPETGQPKGSALSLIGGNINIVSDPDTGTPATLMAPSGQINLVSVTSPGEILFPGLATGPNIDGASFTTMGTVTIKERATLDVSGRLDEFGNPIGNGNSGTVFVRGGQLVMNASTILVTTVGAVDGASTAIDIQVLQDVTLSNRAVIITRTSGPGRVGDVHITADSLTLDGRSRITTSISELGVVGGDLFLNVGRLSLLGSGTLIRSINTSGTDLDGDERVDATGKGGNINITAQGMTPGAGSVMLSGGSGITSDAEPGSGGGGQISIMATSLDLAEASFIKSSTSSTGIDLNHDGKVDVTGDGGDIVMSVQQLSVVGGATISSNTGDADPTSAAAGGMVTVQGLEGQGSKAGSVLLSDPGTGISSDSASGMPGDITVNAGTLTITNGAVIAAGNSISGPAGKVTVTADSIVISAAGNIFSQSFAQDAGKVTITANNELTLDNGSIVTSTTNEGHGGDVVVNAGTVSLLNKATINSSASLTGPAGNITMTVGTLSLTNGSSISSASTGTDAVINDLDGTTQPPGTAGNITITAMGSFTSDASSIATSAEANHGGDISITAQSVGLSNGTLITANSKAPLEVTKLVLDQDGLLVSQVVGDGNAGNITAHSDSTFVMNNSSMTTEATQASGGQVEITAPNMVQLINSKISTSVAGSDADTTGGNIMIDPQFVVLQNSQIIAQAFAGAGGAINIIATSAFIADPLSIVNASSTLGISGTVNIQSPLQNIGGELTALTQEFSSAAALLAQQCAARAADGKFSTFVVAAREGLPVEPGGFLTSPSWVSGTVSGTISAAEMVPDTLSPPKYDARPIQLAKLGNACHQ